MKSLCKSAIQPPYEADVATAPQRIPERYSLILLDGPRMAQL